VLNFPDRQPHRLDQRPRRAGHHQIDRRNAEYIGDRSPSDGSSRYAGSQTQRSLVRWSLIALAVVVVAMIIYLLTGGSGTQLPPMR
jgi:hypothetical protein